LKEVRVPTSTKIVICKTTFYGNTTLLPAFHSLGLSNKKAMKVLFEEKEN